MSRPRVIQHGQKRPHPMTPARAFWITVAAFPVTFVVVYVAVRMLGGGM